MNRPTIITDALDKKREARDLALFTPALAKGSILARLDILAERMNEAEEFERSMARRDLP